MSPPRSPVALIVLVLIGSMAGCRRPRDAEVRVPADDPGPASPAIEQPRDESRPRPAGRRAARADRAWLAAARDAMTAPVDDDCGPYLLVTDVADPAPRELCRRLGVRLDEVYRSRFGLAPVGEPAGAILLFRRRNDFRRFAAAVAGLGAGYAGFSRAARGLVALPVDGPHFGPTLAHELTHLVNRRALGSDLPPWLAEGLADAVGDAVGETGLEDLEGLRGVEGPAGRLARALGDADPPRLARLAALGRGEFDRTVPSHDYELAAVAVRFFLLEEDLATDFRRFLARLADGEPYSPGLLPATLGLAWEELDRRLATWLDDRLSRL